MKAYSPKPRLPSWRARSRVNSTARPCDPSRASSIQAEFRPRRGSLSIAIPTRQVAEGKDVKIAPTPPRGTGGKAVVQPAQRAIEARVAAGQVLAFSGGRDHRKP